LEGAQAGLSWRTILERRDNYQLAFDNFDFMKVAKYDESTIQELLQNSGIIRKKLKIGSTVSNAQAFIQVRSEFGSFSNYIWGFVDNTPIQNDWKSGKDIPAKTELSEKITKDLKNRGFKFVGPTIVYAFMQAIGMVNDHTTDCFRHAELKPK